VTVGVTATRRIRRRWAAFGILLGVSVVLMALSSNPAAVEMQKGIAFALSPIEGALASVASAAGSAVDTLVQIDALHRKNEALQAENDRLTALNASLEAAKRDNEELSALLQLKSTLRYRTVAAQVIGRDSSEFRRVVTLGRGSSDGISLGDVVIGEGGALVGRVARVGPDFAQVLLITDTSSTVVGEVTAAKATGEVVGQLGGALVMENVDSTARVQINDKVITAGISLADGIRSPYPRGLIVGTVLDVARDPNAVVQTAYLQPMLDLDRITNVLVITDYSGGIIGTDPSPSPGSSDAPAATGELPPPASAAP
jgi:rod shape-determining protein MreC